MFFRKTDWKSDELKQNGKELKIGIKSVETQTAIENPREVEIQTDISALDVEDLEIRLAEAEQRIALLTAPKELPKKMQVTIKVDRLQFLTQDVAELVANTIWTEIRLEGKRPMAAGRTHAADRNGMQVKWGDTLRLLLPADPDKGIPIKMAIAIWTVSASGSPVLVAKADGLLETDVYGHEVIMQPPSCRLLLGSIEAEYVAST